MCLEYRLLLCVCLCTVGVVPLPPLPGFSHAASATRTPACWWVGKKKKGRAESLEEIPPEPSDGRNHSTKFFLNGPGRNHSKKFLLYPRMGGITQRNPSCTNVFLGPGRKHLKNFLLYPRMGGIPQRNSSCTETSWPGGGGNNTGNGGQTGPRQGPRSGCRTASGR